ncbi:hypothetical protein cgR_5032 [Corynebacterium glutamicum R]|uniref:Uncharacterized protein n=1 Tax=Corynebacterium glutamicum (strain R) TaxID=340322 RepID=A0AB72VB76_CORGB|nr:hypothetical protein cgR_5032 [Corynebacterium glutamicum R]
MFLGQLPRGTVFLLSLTTISAAGSQIAFTGCLFWMQRRAVHWAFPGQIPNRLHPVKSMLTGLLSLF